MLNDPVASFHALLKKKYGKGLAWKNEKGEWEFWHSHYARDVIEKKRETIRHLPSPHEGFEKAFLAGKHIQYIAENLSDDDATDNRTTNEMSKIADKFKKKEAGTMTKQEVRLSKVESKHLLHGIPLPGYPEMVTEYMWKANFKGDIVSMVRLIRNSIKCLFRPLTSSSSLLLLLLFATRSARNSTSLGSCRYGEDATR